MHVCIFSQVSCADMLGWAHHACQTCAQPTKPLNALLFVQFCSGTGDLDHRATGQQQEHSLHQFFHAANCVQFCVQAWGHLCCWLCALQSLFCQSFCLQSIASSYTQKPFSCAWASSTLATGVAPHFFITISAAPYATASMHTIGELSRNLCTPNLLSPAA